tara:strand:- start:3342 stop:4301 length:960 start_codon:yes stop_codon:yes gene_type:complete
MKKKISYRSNFSEKIIFVSGLTRSGKTLLCPVVSSLKKVENYHIINLVEEILRLYYSGFIKVNVADHLIKTIINQIIYENAIGRNFNLRKSDLTSLWNYKNPKEYLSRLKIKDKNVLNKIKKMKRIIPFMIHDGLIFSDILLKSFPKSKIFHLQRHPIDVIFSFIKKGKEGKENFDQRHLYALFEIDKKKVPYHSIKFYQKYHELNYKDRVIKVFDNLINEHSKSYNLLTKKQKKRIKFINFDSLVSNPKKELKKICLFLKTTKSNVTNKILKRENCPRKIDLVIRKKKFNFIKKKISQNSEKILLNIIKKYNSKKLFF